MSPADRSVDAVLFDLDGTLVDSLRTIAGAMVEVLRTHGHETDIESLIPRIGPPMEIMAREFGATPGEAMSISDEYRRVYHEGYIQSTPAHAGAETLLDELHAAGVALAVVTNKVEEGGRLMLEVMGWSHRFPVVVGRDTPAAPKPDAEAALHALRALGIPPERAAFVGDTEFDMRCGVAAGLPYVIGIVGARDEAFLRAEGATHVVTALDQVGPLLLGTGVAR